MNSEVQRLFEAALEISPDQRDEFLRRQTADAEVQREVLSLIAHEEVAESFFEQAIRSTARTLPPAGLTPDMPVGPYRVVSLLGRGGMGDVYLAERADGSFDRQVAIKLIQSFGSGAFELERFQQERRILARLNHPNIARLLDGGQTAQGVPYLVMECVAGQPIDAFCTAFQLTVEQRLRLFLKVSDAVRHAHQNLIVHRDIKPANILVTAEGEPKLLDFGIAKVLDPAQPERASTRVLTPEYASPEQVRGDLITTASDVYSLAVVLYLLLTGRPPHNIRELAPLEAARVICEEEAPPARTFCPDLPADLAAILAQGLRKDPARRFRSVEAFADDIRRYLEGRPVQASPDTLFYRTGKFLRRNWAGVTAAITVSAILAGAAGLAIRQGNRAARRFAQVRKLADTFLFDFEQSIRPLAGSTPSRQLVVKTALEYLESLASDAKGDAGLTRDLAAAYRKIGDIQGEPGGANIGDVQGALRSYRRALAMLDSLGDGNSRNAAQVRNYVSAILSLAAAEGWTGDLGAAQKMFGDAQQITGRLLSRESDNPDTLALASRVQDDFADALLRASDLRGARDHREQALAFMRRAAAARPALDRSLPGLLTGLGSIDIKLGETGKAIDSFRQAIATLDALSKSEPDNALHRRGLMIAASRLSITLVNLPKPTDAQTGEAIALGRRALAIAQAAAATDPGNARALSDLMATTNRLGTALTAADALAEASEVYLRAVRVAEESVRRDPDDREALLNRALCHGWYGQSCARRGLLSEAIRERRFAEAEYARMAAMSPTDTRILTAQAANWLDLGKTLFRTGDRSAAMECYRQGVALGERLAAADPANQEIRGYLDSLRRNAALAEKKLPARR